MQWLVGGRQASASCSEPSAEEAAPPSLGNSILFFFVRDDRCECAWIMCLCLRAGSLKRWSQ